VRRNIAVQIHTPALKMKSGSKGEHNSSIFLSSPPYYPSLLRRSPVGPCGKKKAAVNSPRALVMELRAREMSNGGLVLQGLKMRKQRSTGDLEKRGTSASLRSTGSSASWVSTDSAHSAVTAGSVHTDSNASFVVEVRTF
jgi:hypothetical protein